MKALIPLYSDRFSHTYWCNKYVTVYLMGQSLHFLTSVYFCPLRFVLILANSADPHEMQYVVFHLGLHCLQKYSFRGFQYTKG